MTGFELLADRTIPELNSRARLYLHTGSGARLLSVENDDENKTFGISFRTIPADSTGVAHILEHTVLCGSRKYPLKDPFIELVKGSLNTFINAFTYPDKTCYPVASQNVQDFYNLIDVYLDAVLYPLIPEHGLQQEGWRYEVESLDDPASPLVFKGVVFNEMKGAYSSPDNLLYRTSQQALFPGHPYGVDSGGDPQVIPDLTYAQFKDFHTRYYHPSNAYIFMYGDDDPARRLEFLDRWLAPFSQQPPAPPIPFYPSFAAPRLLREPYPVSAEDANPKALLTVNFLLPEALDPRQALTFSVLAHILIGSAASPLRKALIDSGLGEDLAGGGLENELRQMFFSTGLRGLPAENVDKVEPLILETLTRLVNDGLDPEMVAASLNTIEFRLRENNTGSYPRGLLLMLRALTTWLHDGDPLAALAFEAPLTELKQQAAADPRYFEALIQRHFLDNSHRVTVILEPDPGMAARLEAQEQARLQAARAQLNPDDIQHIIAAARALKTIQETPDTPAALATIPSLTLADLDRQTKTTPQQVLPQSAGRPLHYHDLFTNGILYFDVGFDLHALPQEWIPYVPLFSTGLLQLGTTRRSYVQLLQQIGQHTGGIGPTTYTSSIHKNVFGATLLLLRGKALADKTPQLLDLMTEILTATQFDNRERFTQLLLEAKARSEAALVPAGHRYANSRLRASDNLADWVGDQLGGIPQILFLRDLLSQVQTNWSAVLEILEGIRAALLNRAYLVSSVTLDAPNWARLQPQVQAFLESLPAAPQVGGRPAPAWRLPAAAGSEGWSIPAQVNYVGRGANLYRLGYQFHGSAQVAANFLRTSYLYEKIRLQGGAYGGYCSFDRQSGVLTYLSYRDPNLVGTLQNFAGAAAFLSNLELSEAELTRAIIGVISDLDAYQLPDARGYSALLRTLTGITDAERQRIRDEVLATRPEDLRQFGAALEAINTAGRVVVLGSAGALESANASLEPKLTVQKLL